MSMFNDPVRFAPSGPGSPEPRWSVRDSYLPATGLLLATVASLALWIGLADAVRWASTALF